MKNRRPVLNYKLIFVSSAAILALITFSTLLVKSVQENTERRSAAVVLQNDLTYLISCIRADVAESLLPVHSYVILPNQQHKKKFDSLNRKIEKNLEKLATSGHFEDVDRRLVQEALDEFKQLVQAQTAIFELQKNDISKLGPARITELDKHQDTLLTKLHKLTDLEQAELASFISTEQTSTRRTVFLIALAAIMTLVGALVIGYISNRM